MEQTIIIVTGKICEFRRTVKKFKNGKESDNKLFVSIKDVQLNSKKLKICEDAFAEVPNKKYIPQWVKDFKGYINVSTQFELPCRYKGVKHSSTEDFIADENFIINNALVRLSLNVKDNAIYPNALDIITEGEEIDRFGDFDKDDEYIDNDDDLPFGTPSK